LTASFILICSKAFSLPSMQIDYYGVVSQSQDASMLKMAQDIFFTQLNSLDNSQIDDKRTDPNSTLTTIPEFQNNNHYVFFAELTDSETSAGTQQWTCVYNAVNSSTSQKVSRTVVYESYYNILVGSKGTIEELFNEISTSSAAIKPVPKADKDGKFAVNLDSLAGNWAGEKLADKIVILRGGRGFVIYKNGASMNISVTVTDIDSAGNITGLKITQTGKANASFYPDLPRELALTSAANADPVTWELKLTSAKSMSGIKNTLVYSPSLGKAVKGQEEVNWFKK